MKWTTLLTLFLVVGAADVSAQSRTLRWSKLAVTANLDADGRLHVVERHSIVFDGEWNGGERVFRGTLEDELHLERISRVEDTGSVAQLHGDPQLARVNDYAWTDSSTLRWRSRLPSDPPFEKREITYIIEYTYSRILIPEADWYQLDHNFGLPDLEWPIDAFSVDLTLDKVWQPLDRVPAHITRANLPRGQNVTVTARLKHTGAVLPAGVNFGAPPWVRFALLFLLAGGAVVLGDRFCQRERTIGRFKPLADPATIDRSWLDEHVLGFRAEVVGAAWDNRTAEAEVAALIARLVQEKKMTSRVDKDEGLVLTLLCPKDSFAGYEDTLVKSLFFAGNTTSTKKIKAHYKKKGFDPVARIRGPLEERIGQMGKNDRAPKITKKWTAILAVAGIVLLLVACSISGVNASRALGAGFTILVLYLAGLAGAIDFRRRLSGLWVRSLLFVPAILLILWVPASLLLRGAGLRLHPLTLGGAVLLALALVRSLLNLAKSRDAGDRLENRRRLTAARDYFARQLRLPNPALNDAWFPYVLAFGLGKDADRWFRSFGGTSTAASESTFSSSSTGSTSSASGSGGTAWSGFGGGASGGAGATGAWAVAATTMASGVASPSSSGSSGGSSGGGGGGGGGSSGGGGGGGW